MSTPSFHTDSATRRALNNLKCLSSLFAQKIGYLVNDLRHGRRFFFTFPIRVAFAFSSIALLFRNGKKMFDTIRSTCHSRFSFLVAFSGPTRISL